MLNSGWIFPLSRGNALSGLLKTLSGFRYRLPKSTALSETSGMAWHYPRERLDYHHIRNYYLPNSKTLQGGNGNGNFGEINSNDFQDGNWESMEVKG